MRVRPFSCGRAEERELQTTCRDTRQENDQPSLDPNTLRKKGASMKRRPTTQDISWFLDLKNNGQLELDPPYQRRSVWTRKDRQFFLDTIYRDYPSPAIFLHKTTDEKGRQIYNVVDGKQRLKTILDHVGNTLAIAKDFGDADINGKKWPQVSKSVEWRNKFWNYVLTVEILDVVEGVIVNEVFDRLNRNARKLDRQELRHAKFDGWLIKFAEAESERNEWRDLKVVTLARARRMHDVQFLSELILVVLEQKIAGFDQDNLDDKYATYEDPAETVEDFVGEDVANAFEQCKRFIRRIERTNKCVTNHARGLGNFYSLWSVVAIDKPAIAKAGTFARRYARFMTLVEECAAEENPDSLLEKKSKSRRPAYTQALKYFLATQGASTDLAQRETRHNVLAKVLARA